ncbi:MAG TPA: hypothetical protein VEF89_31570 [Solirubrobacteraceae bacterium]|nr:hypothetical protein [Solirubrobacteraceae bacterium]
MSTTETEVTQELSAPPQPADQYESCEHCSAPVEATQRYCVVCGTRRKHVYDPAARFLAEATGHRRSAGATRARQSSSPRRSAGLGLALALAAIPLAVALGVLIARPGNNVNNKLLAALRAEKPTVVNVTGGGSAGGATAVATTTAAATSTMAARLTSAFGLQQGYAVELETLPGSGTTQATVAAAEGKARAHGATAVGLISQSDFKVTPAPPAGDYVIYSGQYNSSAAATAALAKLKHAFPSAKVIAVRSASAAASPAPVLSSTQYGSAHAVTGYKPTSSQLSQGAQIVNQESKETNGNYTKSQQGLPDAISVP